MLPEIGVSLVFLGVNFEPDAAARRIGVQPTKTWLEGDPVGTSKLKHKQSGFSVELPNQRTFELEPVLRSLLASLADLDRSALRESKLRLEVACVVYVRDETPVLHLGADTLAIISGLDAALDIDLILVAEP